MHCILFQLILMMIFFVILFNIVIDLASCERNPPEYYYYKEVYAVFTRLTNALKYVSIIVMKITRKKIFNRFNFLFQIKRESLKRESLRKLQRLLIYVSKWKSYGNLDPIKGLPDYNYLRKLILESHSFM